MKRLLIFVLALCCPALATTYYVDNCVITGNDLNNGTATGTPWLTIAHVNAQSFSAGDSILFEKTCTWREQLNPPSSGSSVNAITFGAYGSGALPIIKGSDLFSSWSTEVFTFDGYVTLDSSAKYVSTPAAAANVLSGTNFRLEADVALTSYTSTDNQTLIDKELCCTAAQRHYAFDVYNNQLEVWLFNGAGGAYHYSASTLGILTAGVRYELRANVIPDNGSGGSAVAFYYSTDGSTYAQLGSIATDTNHTVNASNSEAVTVGQRPGASAPAKGKIYRARAWSDINGSARSFDSNLNDYTSGSTWVSATTGETWTIAGSASVTPTSSPTIYYETAGSAPNPGQVFRDAAHLTLATSKSNLATGYYWWDAGNSRIYVFSDPPGHSIEASQRDHSVYISSKTYITLDSLDAEQSNTHGIYANNAGGIVVGGATSRFHYYSGVRFDSGTSTPSTITQTTGSYNGFAGVDINSTPGILVDQVTAEYNCQPVALDYCSGIKFDPGTSTTNAIVQYSIARFNGIGMTDWRGGGIWADTVGTGLVIKYNLAYSNNLMGIYLDVPANGGTVFGNVSFGNGSIGAVAGEGIDIFGDSGVVSGTKIYNNTVYGNQTAGVRFHGSGIASGCINNLAKNNIAIATLNGPNFSVDGGCDNPGTNGSGNIYTYNSFGTAASNFLFWNSSSYSNYSTWEAATGNCGSGGCSNSIQTEPTLTGSILAYGSSAIDAGVNLGSTYQAAMLPISMWPAGVVTANQNSYGASWDIGAFIGVFGSGIGPGVGLGPGVSIH